MANVGARRGRCSERRECALAESPERQAFEKTDSCCCNRLVKYDRSRDTTGIARSAPSPLVRPLAPGRLGRLQVAGTPVTQSVPLLQR